MTAGPHPKKKRQAPGEGPERALVRALQQGAPEAYEKLLSDYEDRVYRLAFRFTRNRADAEEVTQNVFLQVFRKIGTFQGESALSSWIYRVTANAALMHLRKRRRKEEPLEDHLPEIENPASAVDGEPPPLLPEDRVLSGEAVRRIDEAVAGLPEDYRAVFVMRDVEGLSNEEVAGALGLKVPAVKSRLHRARLKLRDALAPYFGKEKDHAH